MSRLWIAARTLIYAPVFLAAWAAVAWWCRRLDPYIPVRVPMEFRIPGAVLGLAGAALALLTVVLFVAEGRGTPAVFDPPKRFVPRGPYRIVRNPMYIGGVSMLAGWALYAQSAAMLLYAAGAFVVIHTFVVRAEEPGLRKRFGNEYDVYCRAVPRWLPRLTVGAAIPGKNEGKTGGLKG